MPGDDPKNDEAKSKLAELVKPAEESLADLLQFKELKRDQWFMRLSSGGDARGWEFLTADSASNDRMIKEKITQSEKPVTELVLAFVGMFEWKGSKRLMAYLQVFRSDCELGLLCLHHLKEGSPAGKFETLGNLLIASGCKNIWI
jgi:hypothetical protein